MSESNIPPIPEWLTKQPTVGGLVVPWITPRTADGRYLLGSVNANLAGFALQRRLCGVCGRSLKDDPHLAGRMMLLMRLCDVARRCSHEPALHPQCAAYTIAACPMVGGHLDHYRSTAARLDSTMVPASDAAARRGSSAEAWFSVWLSGYEVITDHGNPAASYTSAHLLRIRSITWRLPGVW
jgi:hypothetical protein